MRAFQTSVALGGPDARVVDPFELVPRALDVERHGVVEDRVARVAWGELLVYQLEGFLECAARAHHLARAPERRLQEGARVLDRLIHGRAADDRAATPHELVGVQGKHRVERGAGPVGYVGVSHVRCCLSLHQVAGEQDPFLWEPDDEVTRGMSATEESQLNAAPTELQAHLVLEGVRGAGKPGDGVGALEEARHAALLARPVLETALLDQLGGHGSGDDPLGHECRRA